MVNNKKNCIKISSADILAEIRNRLGRLTCIVNILDKKNIDIVSISGNSILHTQDVKNMIYCASQGNDNIKNILEDIKKASYSFLYYVQDLSEKYKSEDFVLCYDISYNDKKINIRHQKDSFVPHKEKHIYIENTLEDFVILKNLIFNSKF